VSLAEDDTEAFEEPVPSTARTLRRLYLILFLRGGARTWRTTSYLTSLSVPLFIYACFGVLLTLGLWTQPIFAIAVYLHAATFIFLGMFMAGSAGEVLFNSVEADTLLFRPIEPRTLLSAKVAVLTQISVCVAWALNAAGILAGIAAADGGWRFLPAHTLSTLLEALFCCGCIVLVYELCLKWFGRERLEGWMTTAQVTLSASVVLAGQLMPRLAFPYGTLLPDSSRQWMFLLPPAWFAGLDDALVSGGSFSSWVLAFLACAGTGITLWAALGKLTADYGRGLQRMADVSQPSSGVEPARRWGRRLLATPPLSWWLRHPAQRAACLLTFAYLLRDRDVKLRVYPAIAPIAVIPLVTLWREPGARHQSFTGFAIAFAGCILGLVPLYTLDLLRQSQQWRASELFRLAPLAGPAELCDGARKAVLLVLVLPLFAVLTAAAWTQGLGARMLLLIPGLVALPVYSMMPCRNGDTVPLSAPPKTGSSVNRFAIVTVALLGNFIIAGVGAAALRFGWFWYFVAGEFLLALPLYISMKRSLARACWQPIT